MITINLTPNSTSFRPGDTISGTVNWSTDRVKSVEARLIWYTEGKGDTDVEIARTKELKTDQNQGQMPFEFKAPHRPHSFSGKLVSLTWAIEAVVLPGKDSQKKDIVIAPLGKEIELITVKDSE